MNFLFVVFYSIGIRAYYFGVVISSLWNSKAKQWLQGRKNLFQKIESSLKPNEYRVWFHCASVGEFEQGRADDRDLPQKISTA
jgi:3-deoxy-D-manno-octulosonic-acid transferase